MKFSPVALAAVMNIAVPLYAQAPGAHEVSASGGIASIGGDDAATVSSPWGRSFLRDPRRTRVHQIRL